MQAQYLAAKEAYYNEEPIMTDKAFDKLENDIRALAPKWKELAKTGVEADKKMKAELPNYMPSLNKCYPEQFPKWLTKRNADSHLLMDKLDGSALHVSYLNGKPFTVMTRGDGTIGGDISFMAKKLNLPTIKDKAPRSMRCEAVISKKNFKKWAKDFDNPRNMVNGLLNRKATERAHPALKDVDIVVLGVYGSIMTSSPADDVPRGLEWAKAQGFKTVAHIITDNVLDNVSVALAHRKEKSPYEIDGLVVTSPGTLFQYSNAEKPGWVTAYKENLDSTAAEAVVEQIIYQVSNRRRIIPKIQIEPVKLDGAMVRFATCHNAKWMRDRKIGPGAVIRILRSGGVIPKIIAVTKPGVFQEPDIKYRLLGVHFVVDGNDDEKANRTIGIQSANKFLGTLGVEFIAVKTIETLYDAGCTTPFHYMSLASKGNVAPMLKAGIGDANAKKIMGELKRAFSPCSLLKLMVASNLFGVGVGERRLTAIQAAGISMTKLMAMDEDTALNAIVKIPGFQSTTAGLVVAGLPRFKKFLATAKKYITVKDLKPVAKKVVQGKLTGQKVSWTGYRDSTEEAAVEAAGGEVVSFGSKTTVLLYKPTGKPSAKVAKAKASGIKVVQFKDLKV